MSRSVHPFPARMASTIALDELRKIKPRGVILDPMVGSGTVVRQASELGHRALGFDSDPLAVLMTRVWTTPVDEAAIEQLSSEVLDAARGNSLRDIHLPWIDEDKETREFVRYWFGYRQRTQLRKLSFALARTSRKRKPSLCNAADVLRIALSRIIITKDSGASLARDVSHSRPHKVAEMSTFDVFSAFERSVRQLRRMLADAPPPGRVTVNLGDARSLRSVGQSTIDAVLTSPPYLNAIDYMRGHRLSLVWLGHRLSELREIRADNIGSERGYSLSSTERVISEIADSMVPTGGLSERHGAIVCRYAKDAHAMMLEISRVLQPSGKAILVVGNSCLRDVFIRNSDGVVRAAKTVGLKLTRHVERELPDMNRYLPMPRVSNASLGKRMRTETILTFRPA